MPIGEIDASYPDRIDRPVVVICMDNMTKGWETTFHSHRKAQLMCADTGLITIEANEGIWVVPPQGAVWIPSGLIHRGRLSGNAKGYVLFVEPDVAAGLSNVCCTLSVSPFLRALLERTASLPHHYNLEGSQARLMAVLLDELSAAPLEWLHLPMPSDLRLRRLADTMLAAPSEQMTLKQWATRIGMSERNMSRLFVLETGLSINRWRRQMHIITALPMLAQGKSIQSIADDLGYDSSGAFVTMFRKNVGSPPKRFLSKRTAGINTPLALHVPNFHGKKLELNNE